MPLSNPAFLVAALVAAASVIVAVSFLIYDTDMWQHLAGGGADPVGTPWRWRHGDEPDVAGWVTARAYYPAPVVHMGV